MIEERDFQAALERALNAPLRQTRVRRINSGDALITNPDGSMRRFRGASAGTGDLVGFVAPDGLHLEVEVKRVEKSKISRSQRHRHVAINNAGGVHVFVWSEDNYGLALSVKLALVKIDDAIRDARALHFIRRAEAGRP
jgi:hypothetical protein